MNPLYAAAIVGLIASFTVGVVVGMTVLYRVSDQPKSKAADSKAGNDTPPILYAELGRRPPPQSNALDTLQAELGTGLFTKRK